MNEHEKLNYVEFPSVDLRATKNFFEKVFGWSFVDYGPEYTAFSGQGLDGGFFKADQCSSTTHGAALLVFYSKDLEKTLEKVFDAGGAIVKQIFSFPGGRRFHFTEPSGNEFAVWSDDAHGITEIPKNTVCIWYDTDAEEAARFYARTFPNSSVGAVHLAPGDHPGGKEGKVLTVEFTVLGIPCIGLNGGPAFKHTEAFSFQVSTSDQAETDRYWDAIVGNGGEESHCGWCKDKWGVSWQITPAALVQAVMGPDPAAANRAFNAMMQMKKIDIATIEQAVRNA